ncbi:MAG TPA: hydroxyacid dehydrogenase, partial [Thermoanaerobaculia bacterium]
WESKLNDFLAFNERRILPDAGRISKEDADVRAGAEYEEFAARRRAYLEAEAEGSAFRALEKQTQRRQKKKP